MSQAPNPYTSSNSTTPGGSVDDSKMTVLEWVLCILCSGIGCIVGIVYLVQGKKKGGMMIAISLAFAVLWNIISFALRMAVQQ